MSFRFFPNPQRDPADTLSTSSRDQARAQIAQHVDAYLADGNRITVVQRGLHGAEVEFNFPTTPAAQRSKRTITERRAALLKSTRRGGKASRSAKRQQSTTRGESHA